MAVAFRVINSRSWHDLETLFEAPGGPGHCWCMVWRHAPGSVRRTRGAERRKAMKSALSNLVCEGRETGIVACVDGCPAGWVSVAPLETYRSMHGPVERPDSQQRPWCIVCFYVARHFRGRKLMPALMNEAVRHAKSRGAGVIEAFPVDRKSPSYRFMGYVDMFEKAGFRDMGMAGTRRHVVRLELCKDGDQNYRNGESRPNSPVPDENIVG